MSTKHAFVRYTTTSKLQKGFSVQRFLCKMYRETLARWSFKSVFPSFSAVFPLEFLRMDQTLIPPMILLNKTLGTSSLRFTVNSESHGPFGASQRLLSSGKKITMYLVPIFLSAGGVNAYVGVLFRLALWNMQFRSQTLLHLRSSLAIYLGQFRQRKSDVYDR